MLEIVIHQPGSADGVAKLENGAYLIGSGPECHIRINRPEVSSRHAQMIVHDNRMTVMDLGSRNGTFSGEGVSFYPNEPYDVPVGTVIRVGRAELLVRTAADRKPVPPSAGRDSAAEEKLSLPGEGEKEPIPLLKVTGVPERYRAAIREIKRQAHRELLTRLNLKKLAVSGVSQEELTRQAGAMIREILSQLTVPLPPELPLAVLEKELIQEAIGLGPLEYLLERDDITEIMVNGPDQVYVERGGVLYRTDTAFADNNQVLAAIERIVSPLGRRIDESSPMVDARLPDGSRVNAIIPPLSLTGPTVTIRKFSKKPFTAADLIRFGSVSPDIIRFLAVCVAVRKNILISGGTGSGKTTLLNVLSSFLPNRERIVTIEDAAELQLHQEHLVRLESRPPNVEGKGAVTIRDLVRNALRMRPDRIVVGECRGGEALDMLQAMNTGHDGSLTTIHANSPRDALSRLETLVLMAGFDLPLRAIREQIASAIHIVVQISRERDGSRKIVNVSEITKMEGDVITMQDLFVFRQTGYDAENRMIGVFEPTGGVPTFLEEISRAKLDLDIRMFNRKER
ncbi:ATPase, T2SS/T4P/T4SS family [uncultured Victivallis sp.]|uniref:ATPase, T2SS/T4P/T4SS family n=1 Tax=uncultured Victivallis sp. TaxID=354118 RepID=UPI0025D2883F|nr:ATPase, T2SS/T4P/T4SS family [uncultured Victivallis sp.]